ncbi:transmembrane protein 121B [Boleophthalmus pectinirostris]|uniref:transmembrane protein 121B n=1 Tax=Boleophthalmus pectinirostris TaxID=150288 RepID=UPI00242C87EE|nr:transmembrane protein 121B [Boleophthalmus pectinirostris]
MISQQLRAHRGSSSGSTPGSRPGSGLLLSGSSDSDSARPAASDSLMTSAELTHSGAAPLASRGRALYKALCFAVLALQGAVLDFYLIAFTDLSWCSWIATDLVVLSGWAIFFIKNARNKRERACGFHQKSSARGAGLGEFTYAYLAWLIYVIACTPKMVLVVETSILELLTLKVPCGVTGFKGAVLLSAPLLFCLIGAVTEDGTGATRHRAHASFLNTCLDLLDSFTLVELLLRNELPVPPLRYAVLCAFFLALFAPVIWLHELTASELTCRSLCARFFTGLLVNAPLLVVRCFQVYAHGAPVSVFLFKNVFMLTCRALELTEQCLTARGARKLAASNPAHFSHGVSENDMCPHGYVNTLAVNQL